MIYHKWSIVGFALWLRYALIVGHPTTSMTEIYANHLESPGTKAFTIDETRQMFAMFSRADVHSQLSFGDLLEGEVGQRHSSVALRVAKAVWPRRLIRTALKRFGLMIMIDAIK
jgi:hypothetical protein